MSRAERALAANRRLQERLRGILEAIDGALWSNAQMQAKLMHNTWLHPRAGRYRGMRGTAASAHRIGIYAAQRELDHCLALNRAYLAVAAPQTS